MKRALGRYHSPDDRDFAHRMAAPPIKRRSRTWRVGATQDQEATSACVGFAWYGWLQSSPIRQRVLKPDGIYRLAQLLDEWDGDDYEGTSVRGGAKVLALTGQVTEYHWAWSLEGLLPHVMEVGPVVLGTNWYRGMDEPDAEGVVRVKGRLSGGHAYLCYGADVRQDYCKIQNSWGIDWGDSGKALIRFADLERLLAEDGEACAAVEARVT